MMRPHSAKGDFLKERGHSSVLHVMHTLRAQSQAKVLSGLIAFGTLLTTLALYAARG